MTAKKKYLTVAEIATELKIPESTVRYRLKVKKIEPAKVKRAVVRQFYSRAQVDKLAETDFKPGRVSKNKK